MVAAMAARLLEFVRDESGEGTSSSVVRTGLWVLAGLAVVGFLADKVVYPMLAKANGCARSASGMTTNNFTTSTTQPNC